MNARHYRDEVYRLRAHPSDRIPLVVDNRDSMGGVYASLVPFLGFEIAVEAVVTVLPAGLIFPMGFLLFWAFYFTYYRPGTLEAKLSEKSTWHISQAPSILLSALIWFIKLTIVELGELMFFRRSTPHRIPARPQATRPPVNHVPTHPVEELLPIEVRHALDVLGIPNCRDWYAIHRRYRELAKRYHPDLNPHLTHAGSRFMLYDSAFKRLAGYRERYFSKKVA